MSVAPSRSLLVIASAAGVAQIIAGVLMYLAGVYFAPWSMWVSLGVLLLCLLIGVARHRTRALGGRMTVGQAIGAGAAIAFGTGLLYAVYNVITIRFVYPGFLEQATAVTGRPQTLPAIAIGNLIRLTIAGTVLGALTSPFQRRAS